MITKNHSIPIIRQCKLLDLSRSSQYYHPVSRCINIDILRLVGLFCVVLAHVAPPMIIQQIRNFDVPLMVIVSGMAFSMSSNKARDFVPFAKKRFLRLICPCYLFLCLFFLYTFVLFLIANKEFPFSEKCMIDSFLLLHGIGYVWIIRIFLIVALISFVCEKLSTTIKGNVNYLLLLIVVWVFYEFIRMELSSYQLDSIFLRILINDVLLCAIPYGIFFSFGLRLQSFSKLQINIVLICSLMLFIVMGVFLVLERCEFVPTQLYKYPPQLYYGSYSLFGSLLIFKLSDKICLNDKWSGFISLLSSSTMWIYLWHIFVLYNIQWVGGFLPDIINWFPVKLTIIILLSCLMAIIQKKIMSIIILKLSYQTKLRTVIDYCFLK